MKTYVVELAIPRLGKEVRLVSAGHQLLQQALEIQLRAARGGELAADERNVHLGLPTNTRSKAKRDRMRKGSHENTGIPVLPPPSK